MSACLGDAESAAVDEPGKLSLEFLSAMLRCDDLHGKSAAYLAHNRTVDAAELVEIDHDMLAHGHRVR